jgi:hypothetical protein
VTGRKRIAKGIFAFGDVAFGLFAAGGLAVGGVSFGGCSVGLVSLGGLAIGMLLALGGAAIGGFAFGGAALGVVAVGGLGVGHYAIGGGAFGTYVASAEVVDPEAERIFDFASYEVRHWLTILSVVIPSLLVALSTLFWLLVRSQTAIEVEANLKPAGVGEAPRPWGVWVWAVLGILGSLLLMTLSAADSPVAYPQPIWAAWEQVNIVLGYLLSALLFIASIGLLLWQPWGRKAIVAVSVIGLASLLIDLPYLIRGVGSDFATTILADMPADDGLDLETRQFVAGVYAFCLMTPVMLLWLGWMIAQLVYFTRPRIVAAFERSQ